MSAPPVVIYPPNEDGGRRVRIDGTICGRAYNVQDVAWFMQEAGLQDGTLDILGSPLIDWGGGPEQWTH